MAIKDLNRDFNLIQQWNDITNCQTQVMAWVQQMNTSIVTILSNPDYAVNVSAEESAYVSSLQNLYPQFASAQPLNPDK